METVTNFFQEFHVQFGPGVLVILILMLFIGIIAQWKLYEKSGQAGYAALIPGWNVVVFLKIVGRPANHALLLLIPIYNLYFIIKVLTELCQCYGRDSSIDYLFAILFNGLYVLNLGLSYEAVYRGPVYEPRLTNAQLAA